MKYFQNSHISLLKIKIIIDDDHLLSKDNYNKTYILSWIKVTNRHFIDREWHGTNHR